MTRYFRVTAVLHEDEYEFVKKVSELMQCSLARAVAVCVIWARTNKHFINLLKTLERTKRERGDEQWRAS